MTRIEQLQEAMAESNVDALFLRLCRALGCPSLAADPRFATNSNRTLHADALKTALEAVLGTAPSEHWVTVLEAAGVPCAQYFEPGPHDAVACLLGEPAPFHTHPRVFAVSGLRWKARRA